VSFEGDHQLRLAGSVRHSDCIYGERWQAALRRLCPFRCLLRKKWIVVPERCPAGVDWGVHDLYPAEPETRRTETSWKSWPHDVFYRHFWPINTGWKTPIRRVRRYSLVRHLYDRELARAFAAAFPDQDFQLANRPLRKGLAWLVRRRQRRDLAR
jgi:hypothetical protein